MWRLERDSNHRFSYLFSPFLRNVPKQTEETSGKVMKLKYFISAQICPNFLHHVERQPECVQVVLFAFSNFFNECDELWMLTVFEHENISWNTIRESIVLVGMFSHFDKFINSDF